MLTTRTLSALLSWARNHVDEPLEEVRTAGDTLRLQQEVSEGSVVIAL